MDIITCSHFNCSYLEFVLFSFALFIFFTVTTTVFFLMDAIFFGSLHFELMALWLVPYE